jgi:hypothetical protein
VTHVAIAITARPIKEAKSTRHPNCSRIGILILTIVPSPSYRLRARSKGGEGEGDVVDVDVSEESGPRLEGRRTRRTEVMDERDDK